MMVVAQKIYFYEITIFEFLSFVFID